MQTFTTRYNHLKEMLSQDPQKGADMLVDLVKDYTQSEDIECEASRLRSELLTSGDNREERELIISDMLDIAEKAGRAQEQRPKMAKVINYEEVQRLWLQKKREPNKVVFSCHHIFKTYASSDFELSDVSLELRSGEITGVVGENGNGKTTLLKIIAGVLAPDRGDISYDSLQPAGNGVRWDLVKPQIAYLSQELGRMAGSVKQSIQYAASLHGIVGQENEKQVKYIIQRLGLTKHQDSNWENLSGGYKLRFALARILVWKPKLIVLDEPLANLDINTQMRVLKDLKDLSLSIPNPISIILSSQNIEEVEAVANNMIVLRNGNAEFNGPIHMIGERRKTNLFEFKSELDPATIAERLKMFEHTLDYNGFYYYISVPLSVSEVEFFRYCASVNIPLQYFQDISYSSKKLLIHAAAS